MVIVKLPPEEKATVSAADLNIPVLVSVVKEYVGAPEVPFGTSTTPVTCTPPLMACNFVDPSCFKSTPALPFIFIFLPVADAVMSISPEVLDTVFFPVIVVILKSVPSCSIVVSPPAPIIIFDVSVKVISSAAEIAISVPLVVLPISSVAANDSAPDGLLSTYVLIARVLAIFVLEAPTSVVLVMTFVPDIAPFITKPVKLPRDVTFG